MVSHLPGSHRTDVTNFAFSTSQLTVRSFLVTPSTAGVKGEPVCLSAVLGVVTEASLNATCVCSGASGQSSLRRLFAFWLLAPHCQ